MLRAAKHIVANINARPKTRTWYMETPIRGAIIAVNADMARPK